MTVSDLYSLSSNPIHPLFAMKLWNALKSLALGFGPWHVTHHRQDWNMLTWLGSHAFYLCHWHESIPGLPTGSGGLIGGTWSRYVSCPGWGQHSCPAKPSLDLPTYRLISKRSASCGRPLTFCTCYAASLWPQLTDASLGTVWPWAIPLLPVLRSHL